MKPYHFNHNNIPGFIDEYGYVKYNAQIVHYTETTGQLRRVVYSILGETP